MKQVTGWWFGREDRKLGYDDDREIVIGKTHIVVGEIIPCKRGLHLSKRLLDALNYAPGPVIYKVRGSGIIVPHGDPVDKYACFERTYLAGGVDISETLRAFARSCALEVVHLWNAPEIVIEYLKTGDRKLRAEAQAADWAAQDAAWAADWVVWTANWAAWTAAQAADWAADWAARAAQDVRAVQEKQNKQLTIMVNDILRG